MIKNLQVQYNKNKVKSLQNKSTPGIYKIFNVKLNQKYKIILKNFKNPNNLNLSLWICNKLNKKNILIQEINNLTEFSFINKFTNVIKIGILFKKPNINDFFFLSNIKIIPIITNNPNNIQQNNINNIYQNNNNNKINEITNKENNLEKITEIINKENNLKKITETKIKTKTILIKNNHKEIIKINKNSLINNNNNNNIIENNKNNLISIIIPCYYKHHIHLDKLLNQYKKQTKLPNEVIVVISEYQKIQNKNCIEQLEKNNYPFILKIIKLNERSAAGNNRYIGTKKANGNLIIFQDADDIPHQQRIEIIEYFFNKYPEIVHICHKFTKKDEIDDVYQLDKIECKKLKTPNIFMNSVERIASKVTNGNIAIRKKIYNHINWFKYNFRGQDVMLNKNIFEKYKKTLFIQVPLYYYRIKLSAKKYIMY